MKEEEIEVYNNGNGWRIAISLFEERRVLTIEEAQEICVSLKTAMFRILFSEWPGKESK